MIPDFMVVVELIFAVPFGVDLSIFKANFQIVNFSFSLFYSIVGIEPIIFAELLGLYDHF